MTPLKHEWTRLRGLLERAMELEGELRARFIDEACAGDAALRAELEALLAKDVPDDVLEPPRIEQLARALDEPTQGPIGDPGEIPPG